MEQWDLWRRVFGRKLESFLSIIALEDSLLGYGLLHCMLKGSSFPIEYYRDLNENIV